MKLQDYWKDWKSFLQEKFFECELTNAEGEAFFISFERQNIDKDPAEIAVLVLKGSDEVTALMAYKKRMGRVYKKFGMLQDKKDKFKQLRDRLETEYSEWLKNKVSDALSPSTVAMSGGKDKVEVLEDQKARSLQALPSQFQALIEDKTKDFVGREYVFTAIENFLSNQPNGYFTIEGDPGMGKSAILAEYVRRTGCVAHFNVQGQYETAEEFLKTVRTELSNRYQLTPPSLPSDARQYGAFLDQLLAEAARQRNSERVVIAIDALDEVDLATQQSSGNILYLPPYLHEGIYFVMTRRRGVEIPFITHAPQHLFKLMEYSNQSREDVRTYIQNRVNASEQLRQRICDRGETETEFIDKIAEKSENNFMYLRYVLQDIEQGLYQDLSLERFPQGLQQYYEFHWRRMGMTVKPLPVTKINVVYHLAESHQPISRQLISEYVGDQELTVQEVLDEWQQFLHQQPLEGEICYSVYHASFRDFLHRKDVVQAAGVSLKAIKKQKSDILWEAMFGDE